jgi:hypothetical protein
VELWDTSASSNQHRSSRATAAVASWSDGWRKERRRGSSSGFIEGTVLCRWKGSGAWAELAACLVGATVRWLAVHGHAIAGTKKGMGRGQGGKVEW